MTTWPRTSTWPPADEQLKFTVFALRPVVTSKGGCAIESTTRTPQRSGIGGCKFSPIGIVL